MSAYRSKPDNKCSMRAFPVLTHLGHRWITKRAALSVRVIIPVGGLALGQDGRHRLEHAVASDECVK